MQQPQVPLPASHAQQDPSGQGQEQQIQPCALLALWEHMDQVLVSLRALGALRALLQPAQAASAWPCAQIAQLEPLGRALRFHHAGSVALGYLQLETANPRASCAPLEPSAPTQAPCSRWRAPRAPLGRTAQAQGRLRAWSATMGHSPLSKD